MANVGEHYETLLADHYTWLYGGFGQKLAEQHALFDRFGILRANGARALDLGCGSGFQSVALAERGYSVLALDTSRKLLAELESRKAALPIETRQADIEADLAGLEEHFALAVCMGDTLTHLSSKSAVSHLFEAAGRLLEPGGRLILTYRDLTPELTGLDRFIPLRSDADRAMMCFLEYAPQTVTVHDLVHLRCGAQWTLAKSSYAKLRLAAGWVCEALAASGFVVECHDAPAGMTAIVALRAAA